ncbi:hypothetical protein KP78_02690 [Jeotgalibacillus soli]|uniref:Molybdopterin-guanine dinucleotide biosynthesis protein B (MobB) domain-containing protein n=1 Tax=Jeotgalibacillus soli TaxID=889306 RepID=A0A0C2SD55_9BACL|nr:hypothetical protein KP78_02690 [Jeotgalibacillus soli]
MGEIITILQVVGFQNSGKTTVVSKLIEEASRRHFRIASIKHHGHGGIPDLAAQSKDSERHRQAGAVISGVEGGGVLQMTISQSQWQLDEILSIYCQMKIDAILIEGYKHENYPKIVMIKEEEDLFLLDKLENIEAVISCEPIQAPYPVFLINEEERYLEWFIEFIGRTK